MAYEDQFVDGGINLMINGARLAIFATSKMLALIAKEVTLMHLKIQEGRELSGGQRTIAAMLKSGKEVSCLTMNREDLQKLKAHAKEYNFQFHALNTDKKTDNDKDYCTVFIRKTDFAQFQQFVKDYNIGAVSHGDITSKQEKPLLEADLDKLLDDDKARERFMSGQKTFDIKAFMDEQTKRGSSVDQFLVLLEALIQKLLARNLTPDFTNMDIKDPEIDVLAKDFQFPSPEKSNEMTVEAGKEVSTIQDSSINTTKSPNDRSKDPLDDEKEFQVDTDLGKVQRSDLKETSFDQVVNSSPESEVTTDFELSSSSAPEEYTDPLDSSLDEFLENNTYSKDFRESSFEKEAKIDPGLDIKSAGGTHHVPSFDETQEDFKLSDGMVSAMKEMYNATHPESKYQTQNYTQIMNDMYEEAARQTAGVEIPVEPDIGGDI
ncbi:MAG: PcfB family protein [Saccharofermentans sp.]|nr:PcfB family protein [Saccharofermentans sp.]